MKKTELNEEQVSNGASESFQGQIPYNVRVKLQGASDFLFHRWNNESIAAKAASKKGSADKKTDNIESYVYRLDNGNLAIPGLYVSAAMRFSAKFKQDPRSPRKSAMDLYRAGVIPLTKLSDLGKKDWDYEDRQRVTIQRSGITRCRPAMKEGWVAEFEFLVTTPEYIQKKDFLEVLSQAGRLIGIGDFRPSYGRFNVINFEVF